MSADLTGFAEGRALNRSLICVVGPPGAGKTTLAGVLVVRTGGSLFRLREAVRRHEIVADGPTPDALGWVSDAAVAGILKIEAEEGRFAFGPYPVVLDNFPGSGDQLQLLHSRTVRSQLGLGVLELVVDDQILADRIRYRRVCPKCHPDLHAPASVRTGAVERCHTCGGRVIRRDSDSPDGHTRRLARYRANIRGLAAEADMLGVRYQRVDAAGPPEGVQQATLEVVTELIEERTRVRQMR